jgi:uncharacterized phage infection (PIP) family protein YhgE
MTKDSAKESGTSAKTVERWVWPSQKETTLKNEGKESETLTNQAPTQFDSGHGGARKGAGRKRDDFNAIFDTEERLFKELNELPVIEKFKSLFDTEKRLSGKLDELNKKKSDVLKELKEILYNRDDKKKELKQLNELIEKEKEMFPKEYEEYRKY